MNKLFCKLLFKYKILIKKFLCSLYFYKKMQAAKSNSNPLGANLNPIKDVAGVSSIDFSADVDNLIEKLDKLSTLYNSGRMDKDVMKYITGMAPVNYQGQIDFIDTKRAYAASTYSDLQQLEFNLEVINNHYRFFKYGFMHAHCFLKKNE